MDLFGDLIFSDAFTGTNSTSLSDHGDGDWTVLAGYMQIQSNQCYVASDNARTRCDGAGELTNFYMQVEQADTIYRWRCFGIEDADNFYYVNMSSNEKEFYLRRYVGGSSSLIATHSYSTFSPDTAIAMRSGMFQLINGDETVMFEHDLSADYNGGYVGLGGMTGAYMDDFAVYEAPPLPPDPGGQQAVDAIPPTSVHLTPPGRDGFELTLTDEPEYSETARGGYSTATVHCLLDTRHRDRIMDARVRIFPGRGLPWVGRVAQIRQDGPLAELTCAGPQHDLSRDKREVAYCHTAFSEWRERTSTGRDQRVRIAQTENGWTGCWLQGTTYASARHNGIFLRIPTTDACRLVFDWTRYNNTDYRYTVFAGTGGTGSGESGVTYSTAIETQAVGSGGTSGTATIDISKSSVTTLLIYLSNAVEVTPANLDTYYTISNIKVYGVSGITSVTAPKVIGDVCDSLPAWVLPSGDEYRHWIGTDATTIEPLTFGPESSNTDILDETLQYRDFDFGFRSRLVDGLYHAVPVYSARSTTPRYQCYLNTPGISGDVSGEDITAMASGVRVLYTDVDGRQRYVDVDETSEDNYLVTIAQGKRDVIQANTASSTTATLMGQRYLAQRRTMQIAGTLEIAVPITDLRGAEVLPCEIEAAAYIRVHNTPYGSVDARIIEVTKTGSTFAMLTLDNTPTALDTELAMLTKRRQ